MKGKVDGYIGSVPEGSTFHLDNEKIREDVQNRQIPSYYRPNSFPVMDKSNPEELYLVHSAFPKIKKYTIEGKEQWETEAIHTPQIDSRITRFFVYMEKAQRKNIRSRIALTHYVSGVSDEAGNLYLAMDYTPLWIDKYNSSGQLIRRYKINPEEDGEIKAEPVFDIDTQNNRFLLITNTGEIRAYSIQ